MTQAIETEIVAAKKTSKMMQILKYIKANLTG